MLRTRTHRRRQVQRRGFETLESRTLMAVSLLIDYSLDTRDFFDTAAKKSLLQSTLNGIVSKFGDTLAAVPSSTYSIEVAGVQRPVTTSVPANVLKLYVFGSPLPGNTIGQGGPFYSIGSTYRGQGANDFAPNIGYIQFDDDGSTNWYFSASTSGLNSSQSDFVSTAEHEFLHTLGWISQPTFERYHSGNTFTGPNAKAANDGKAVPLQNGGTHVASTLTSVMNSTNLKGQRQEIGPLEYAVLKDLGWSVASTTPPDPTQGEFERRDLLTGGEDGTASLQVFPERGVYMTRIDTLAGDHLVITTTDGTLPAQKGVDTYLRLFDSNGDLLTSNNDGGDGTKSRIVYDFAKGGTYFIGAGTYDTRNYTFANPPSNPASTTNRFFLNVTLNHGSSPQPPNHAYDVTNAFTPTTGGVSRVGAVRDADDHFFGINVVAGRRYQVQTAPPASGGLSLGAFVEVFDSLGHAVAGPNSGDPYGVATFVAARTERYYVRVTPHASYSRFDPQSTVAISPDGDISIGSGWTTLSRDGEFSASGDSSRGSDYVLTVKQLVAPVSPDFDADGKTDYVLFRGRENQRWFGMKSSDSASLDAHFGDFNYKDIPAAADYDGDGVTDFAVFRPGTATFIISLSTGGTRIESMGDPGAGDVPAAGDYDGDGKADLAVFRPATALYIVRLAGGTQFISMGDPRMDDIAVPVDYDNDGKIDPAVFRPGAALYIIRLASGTQFIQMGDPSQGDLPIPGDYDGDGKTDLAVFRPGSATWIIRPSNGAPTRVFQFGDPAQGDLPIQAPIGTLFRRGQLIGGRLTIQSVNTTTPSVEIATTGQVRSAVATATAPYHQAEPSQASQVPLRRSLPGQESVAASRPWHRRGGIWKV